MKQKGKLLAISAMLVASLFLVSCKVDGTGETNGNAVSEKTINGVDPPVAGGVPPTEIAFNGEYTGTVTWEPNDEFFQTNTEYTATITLLAEPGYTLDGVTADFFSIEGANTVTYNADSGIITAMFPYTASTVTTAAIAGVDPPVAGRVPVTVIDSNNEYTGTVTWEPNHEFFQTNTEYTATITLLAEPGYTLDGVTADFFSIEGANTVTNNADSGIITAMFPYTASLNTVTTAAIAGVDPPVAGETPVTVIDSNNEYTGTVTWEPNDEFFQTNTEYTATITLLAEPGYTLDGVTADFFSIEGANTVTNNADSGIITAMFPNTASLNTVTTAAIAGVDPPVAGETPVTVIDSNNEYTGTVTWEPNHEFFQTNTEYTATITLLAEPGYTLDGVTADFFIIVEANTVTNNADSGIITALFPYTASLNTVTTAAIAGVDPPVAGETPVTVIDSNNEYTGTVTWEPDHDFFQTNTGYTATITLLAEPGYTLDGVTADFFIIAGANTVTNNADSGIITALFPNKASLNTVTTAAIAGVDPPVVGETPVTVIDSNNEYTGTVTWEPDHEFFQTNTAYTATITLLAEPGYTLDGVTADFFIIVEANTVTNNADSGIITALFPYTASLNTVTTAAIAGVDPPVAGETPVTVIDSNNEYTGTVTWEPDHDFFQTNTGYTATITLLAEPGYTLDGVTADFFIIAGANTVTNNADSGIITALFPNKASLNTVTTAAIAGVDPPVAGRVPVTVIDSNNEYTGTVTWEPNHDFFQTNTAYTATITLLAEPGYTLDGVTADFFSIEGANTVTNNADSGIITAMFPNTASLNTVSTAAIAGVDPPVVGETPVTVIDSNNEYTGTVTWEPDHDFFQGSTIYKASISLTAKTGYTFVGVENNFFTLAEANSVTNDANLGQVTAEFPETIPLVSHNIISGIVLPVIGEEPVKTITPTDEFTGSITWWPNDAVFEHTTVYTAWINLTIQPGYTLIGLPENFFYIDGADSSTLYTDSKQIRVEFPETDPQIASVSAGLNYTMIIKTDGTLWATGENDYGQLGDGTNTESHSFKLIANDVQSVAAGHNHTMFIKTDGSLWGMGDNAVGQLGSEPYTERHSPIPVASNVKSVAVGTSFTMYITDDGSLWAMGSNGYGQLGRIHIETLIDLLPEGSNYEEGDALPLFIGYTTPSYSPLRIMGGVQSVSTGPNYTMIIKTDGSLWAAGQVHRKGDGDLPPPPYHSWAGSSFEDRVYFVKFLDDRAQSISTTHDHAMLIKTDGSLWATGDNSYGQFGNGTLNRSSIFQPVGRDNVQSVSIGKVHTMIIETDNSLWAAGWDVYGQLGITGTISFDDIKDFTPVLDNVQSVSAAEYHTMAIKTDGSLWATGRNTRGQFGNGTTTPSTEFIQVLP